MADYSFKDLSTSWVDWIAGLSVWQFFITVTFREPSEAYYGTSRYWNRLGVRYARRKFWEILEEFAGGGIGEGYLDVFLVVERHKESGNAHIHALLGSGKFTDWPSAGMLEAFEKRCGFSKLLEYRKGGGDAYIVKYVLKDMDEVQLEWCIKGKYGGDYTT